ncbi:hypothetical protein EVAR_84938_1 [Eumeta japonica]|uniref:Uncharacterized protein n=1 Tax=Eumeta variegata TaxID=151549 RepID=A0A4C1VHJ9_EUMVA|nr:hypothetical protein EVAR_84938_1 [Eumeta japonica]
MVFLLSAVSWTHQACTLLLHVPMRAARRRRRALQNIYDAIVARETNRTGNRFVPYCTRASIALSAHDRRMFASSPGSSSAAYRGAVPRRRGEQRPATCACAYRRARDSPQTNIRSDLAVAEMTP